MMFHTVLMPAARLVSSTTGGQVAAQSDVWNGLLTVLAAIAILSVSLVVLTYLEPQKKAARPPARPGPKAPARSRRVVAPPS